MILFVCEGNVCRSVLAAGLLQKALSITQGVTVGSAGTHALVGEGADTMTFGIATRLGVSLEGHSARQLTPDLLATADMVVTATRQIRSAAVQTYPPSVKYSFTMRQLARILKSTETKFDAGDPRGRPLRVHEQSAEAIVEAVGELARALGGTPVPWSPARLSQRWDIPRTATG
jgi:protein-tyrosine phosphatase